MVEFELDGGGYGCLFLTKCQEAEKKKKKDCRPEILKSSKQVID